MICNYYAVNPPTSSQYIFYCHAKNVQIQIESYDFETLVNSKILFPLGMRSEQGSISGSAFLENTQINNTGVNAKCPPVWLTPCVADGINDDYEALQALIYYCQDHNCKLIIPSGNYKITKTLIINNSITIEGEGCNELFGDIETNANSISIPTVVPHLLGTVIVQESYLTAICIQGKSPVVNLKNFGIILENGGCGIQILPDLLTDGTHRNTGISSSVWDNIKVYSGNAKSGDYSFYLVNFINCTFNNLSSYGGGGIYVASQSNTRYGYSTFIKPKLLLWLGCNSDVFRINDDNISDIDIIKPIVNVFNHINPSNPPTSSQYIFYCPQSASQIKLYDYSFGSNTSIKLLLPNTDDNTLGTIGSDIVNESTQKYRSVLPSGTKLETGGVGAGTSSATSGHVTFQSFSQECKTVFVEVNGINITKSNITKDGFDWTLSGEGNGTFYWLAFGY
jgi:hypothetical protein